MCENNIEIAFERRVDKLDNAYLSGEMDMEEYDRLYAKLVRWQKRLTMEARNNINNNKELAA